MSDERPATERPTDDELVPDDEWKTIVRNAPIVSVDLVVCHDDGVVLGRRENEPARGEWFVPGGRVRKDESLVEAVHRVARDELGVGVEIEQSLGAYEHFWDASEFEDVATKHYLANGFVVRTTEETLTPDDQHGELRVFEPPFPDLHPYVEAYLQDAPR